MVWELRRPLLWHIPPDTTWFKVQHLRREHYRVLRPINHLSWISPNDENELEMAALRATEPCWEPRDEWSPILWGHGRTGPLTILEGNHRMTALARSENLDGIALVAFVGLSAHPGLWHLADRNDDCSAVAPYLAMTAEKIKLPAWGCRKPGR
jgi:hypothetical protein